MLKELGLGLGLGKTCQGIRIARLRQFTIFRQNGVDLWSSFENLHYGL